VSRGTNHLRKEGKSNPAIFIKTSKGKSKKLCGQVKQNPFGVKIKKRGAHSWKNLIRGGVQG